MRIGVLGRAWAVAHLLWIMSLLMVLYGIQGAVAGEAGGAAAGAETPSTPASSTALPADSQQPAAPQQQPAQSAPVVMARVGQQEITAAEYMSYISKDPRLLDKATSPTGRTEILREMIDQLLLQDAMKREGLLEAEPGRPISQAEFLPAYTKLAEEHFPLPEPYSEKEVYQYYLDHKESFGIPATVRITQIQFRLPKKPTAEDREATRARADAALKRLKAGELFDKVAAELTESPRGRLTGGDLGFLPVAQDPWLAAAVRGLKVGQFSDVLESPVGYEIIQVTDRREAIISPFWNVYDQVNDKMRFEAQRRAQRAYIKDLANETNVTILAPGFEGAMP